MSSTAFTIIANIPGWATQSLCFFETGGEEEEEDEEEEEEEEDDDDDDGEETEEVNKAGEEDELEAEEEERGAIGKESEEDKGVVEGKEPMLMLFPSPLMEMERGAVRIRCLLALVSAGAGRRKRRMMGGLGREGKQSAKFEADRSF